MGVPQFLMAAGATGAGATDSESDVCGDPAVIVWERGCDILLPASCDRGRGVNPANAARSAGPELELVDGLASSDSARGVDSAILGVAGT